MSKQSFYIGLFKKKFMFDSQQNLTIWEEIYVNYKKLYTVWNSYLEYSITFWWFFSKVMI